MAGITLAQAEEQLAIWLDAMTAVANGQSITAGGRTYTQVDARAIRENITFWEQKVKRLSRGGFRVRGVTPV
jgi:hypothetical protein